MPVTIIIPTALRQYANDQSELKVEDQTVGAALDRLTTEHAELRRHLFNDENRLRNFINVYVNDEDIRQRSGVETPVKDGDTILIVPSIAGGAAALQVDENGHGNLPVLANDEIARYSRHVILPEVGITGQRKLKAASVLLIGAGGLGAPVGMYLAAAGIGRLGLVDFDVVDESNLQRQIIHGTRDVGRAKLASAQDRLTDINPHVQIETHETRLTSANALQLIANYDVIVDGTDNFATRYLVNDACVLAGKPNVYGSIFRFEGQASVFWAERGPCYRCLYPEPPPPGLVPSCAEGGVLGVLPGIIGTIQANEAIKIILGADGVMVNRLLLFDGWRMHFREVKLHKNPDCAICGHNPTIKELIDYEQFCGTGQPAPTGTESGITEITATELKRRLDRGDRIQIIDVREPHEYEIAQIPNSRLIPLGQVLSRLDEIDAAVETVVHCKMGSRSAKAIQTLRRAGFGGRLLNLKGGITAWANEVDPNVPKY